MSSRARCLLPVCYPAATLAGQSASASRFVFVLLAGDLTPARIPGNLTFPKHYKACRSLRQRPTLERIAAFLVSATEAPRAFRPWDAVTYWRNNVLMFVRLRRPCSGRGALFRLFCFPIPKHYRWLMLSSFPFPGPECAPGPSRCINCSTSSPVPGSTRPWPPCAACPRPCRRTSASAGVSTARPCPWRWRHDCPE